MASQFPPHVSANNGVLRFKVRIPQRLKPHPVFKNKSYWEKSLGLPETASYQDISDTWQQVNQQWTDLKDFVERTNHDQLNQIELQRIAKTILQNAGYKAGQGNKELRDQSKVGLQAANELQAWYDHVALEDPIWDPLKDWHNEQTINPEAIELREHGLEPDMPEELRPLDQTWVMFHQKPSSKKLILWREFWDIYVDSKRLDMTNKNNQNKHKYWNSFLAIVSDQEVSTDSVDDGLREWLTKRTKDPVKDSTVSKEFRQIKAVLNLVDDRENLKLRFSPPKFETYDTEKQKSVFTDTALLELRDFIIDRSQRTYAPWKTFMLMIMWQSSAHQSEIEQLKRQDIHLNDEFPFINLATAGSKLKDKARKRLVPIPFGIELLKDLLADMDEGQDLCFPPSVMKTGKDNRQSQLSRIVGKFGDYQPYSLRHTFKHRLSLVSGAKLMQVQYLQGWSGVDKSQKERLANYGASVFTDRKKHPEVFEEMFTLVKRTMAILDQNGSNNVTLFRKAWKYMAV